MKSTFGYVRCNEIAVGYPTSGEKVRDTSFDLDLTGGRISFASDYPFLVAARLDSRCLDHGLFQFLLTSKNVRP